MEYNRDAAVRYAQKWAYLRNPLFYDFSDIGGDCTNFASQCLLAGGAVMNYTPVSGWYYSSINDRAPAWTGVEELYRFLVRGGGIGPRAAEVPLSRIQPGDIVQLRFEGTGRFDHSPVVVDAGRGTSQTVLIAAHSYDCDCRPLSTYDFNALRPLHITDIVTN